MANTTMLLLVLFTRIRASLQGRGTGRSIITNCKSNTGLRGQAETFTVGEDQAEGRKGDRAGVYSTYD